MDILEVMQNRHSVRKYKDEPLLREHVEALLRYIDICNQEGHLNMQLILNDRDVLEGALSRKGRFMFANNYIAMVGHNGTYLDERLGYYGEKLLLLAEQMGLNTCWVGMSHKKTGAVDVSHNERFRAIIVVGYGAEPGKNHPIKGITEVSMGSGPMPEWFQHGMEAAVLAPSAFNQQKYMLTLDGDKIEARPGMGFCTKLDLGIAKCHFEIGSEGYPFKWTSVY